MNNSNTVFGFNKTKLRQWFLYWLVLCVGLFILIFLITSTWIGVSVNDKCLVAVGKYQVDLPAGRQDCVDALLTTLQNPQESYRTKNYAIWSLGQLGDKRALPALENLYTGQIPPREPYDAGISQYELKKAIKLVGGSFNATSIFWRYDLP